MSPINIKALKGITQDSRQVKVGYLFAALSGENVDGAAYIDEAIAAGASVILAAENRAEHPAEHPNVELIKSPNPRQDFAKIVAEYYGDQPEYIAAVTGTNGKTSVVNFAAQLWQALGIKGKSLGTLTGAMTTPDPVQLHESLAQMAKGGTTHLALEASSHGLAQYRLDGVRVKVAGFTNLSRDHLDYHKTMESYLAAKTRLFTDLLEEGGTAVLNADIPEFEGLKAQLKTRNLKLLSYGRKGAELCVKTATPTPHGLEVELEILGQTHRLNIPLVGEFQLMNLLCALGMMIAEDIENTARTQNLINALENITGVPGRVQAIIGHPAQAGIYVDFAHTPDALEAVLKALRPHTQGRLICLFGCGGDRDAGKRPLMAKIVAEYTDHGIITDDNPRSENPATIRAQALAAAPTLENIGGRAEAIQHGINMAKQGDILVIAGKGHEQGQIFKDYTEPFDDADEARKAIKNYNNNKKSPINEEC